MYAAILRATGNYQDSDIGLFEKEVRAREVLKHELLLRKGEVARSVYYLLEGAVRQYDIVSESEYNTIDLHLAGDWFFNHESLVAQRPSRLFIEAYTDCRFIEISLDTIHYLTGKSIAFLQLNKVLEGAFQRMQFFDQSMTPVEKYRYLLENRPKVIQAFPLKIIASYLKITPETLSRARNAVANGAIS
ncbi:MAG: Crp/Fnr family transcriptional regulator [Dyadobacter sp.]|uniref:Crp/Fnr family transcriptional regulator n=1 Tax=Dyadobacter sp. TaxID=1914288 RepID=UPI001B1E80AA|nr:Crp/Fnr family transcriptional regulator [Dyadobacter sp.]MBO9617013.1 Crp/Fnr family transcriptional regulator [Dyadobacter sp.]